jgi:hypothetical protein
MPADFSVLVHFIESGTLFLLSKTYERAGQRIPSSRFRAETCDRLVQ